MMKYLAILLATFWAQSACAQTLTSSGAFTLNASAAIMGGSGAFTTGLSLIPPAGTDALTTIGGGGTSAAYAGLTLNGGNGVAKGPFVNINSNSVNQGTLGIDAVVRGSGSSQNIALWAAGSNTLEFFGGGRTTNGGDVAVNASGNLVLNSILTGTNADFLCLSGAGIVLLQSTACTISSLRFKPDWALWHGNALDIVNRLEVGTFHVLPEGMRQNRDPNANSLQLGLNAENVAAVFRDAAVYENDMRTPKSYRQESVIALHTAALAEEDEKLDAFIVATGKEFTALKRCFVSVQGHCVWQ